VADGSGSDTVNGHQVEVRAMGRSRTLIDQELHLFPQLLPVRDSGNCAGAMQARAKMVEWGECMNGRQGVGPS